METKKLGILLEVLSKVSVIFPETKSFIDQKSSLSLKIIVFRFVLTSGLLHNKKTGKPQASKKRASIAIIFYWGVSYFENGTCFTVRTAFKF